MVLIKDLIGKGIDDILVSVVMLTYFHEDFISQAIDSVLSQITEYNYEIIISDDGSKDKTVTIIKEYKLKYPDKIRLIIHEENIGLTKNQYEARCAARGKYIVSLSGDDYWIDDKKIQKQVEFMENNLQYIALATVVEQRYDNDREGKNSSPEKRFWDKEFILKYYLHNHNFPTHGMMMRNIYLTEEGRRYMKLIPQFSHYIDDLSECILLLSLSPIFIMNRRTYVYRLNRNNAERKNFNSINTFISSYEKHINLLNALSENFDGRIHLRRRYVRLVSEGLLYGIKRKKLSSILKVNKTIPLRTKKPVFLYIIEIFNEIIRMAFASGIKLLKKLFTFNLNPH